MTNIDPILTVEKAAEWLRCSTRKIEDMARAGKLPGKAFGDGGYVFPAEAFFKAVNRLAEDEAAERKKKSITRVTAVGFKVDANDVGALSSLGYDIQCESIQQPIQNKRSKRQPPGLHLLPQAGGKILPAQ